MTYLNEKFVPGIVCRVGYIEMKVNWMLHSYDSIMALLDGTIAYMTLALGNAVCIMVRWILNADDIKFWNERGKTVRFKGSIKMWVRFYDTRVSWETLKYNQKIVFKSN